MNDKDTNTAAIAVSVWFVAFAAAMFIADGVDRTVGLLLMAFSTAFTVVWFWAKDRIDAERRRWQRYAEDCAKRELEAREWLRR